MFGGDDEDGDFLSPTGGAKLASLFGLDRESSQGNESFQYTAPKQPRKSSNPAPSNQKPVPQAGAPAVLFATAVQAFRYINEQYVKQGKLGAAVLGSHTTKEYKLLLYLSQQKQVAAAKIHVGFVFTVQPNNYCSFYDDQRQNWSLMFESDKTAVDFCKEICLAKANSSSSLDTVVVQDLSLGEGQGVENGDSLEVVYTGWLLQNHTIGQMFDSNQNKDKLLRLKIGAGKVIKGWEEGMLGMQKEGSRLIVIPPNLAYGSKGVPNRVPSDSTLIFEAELRRVKFSKDSGSDRTSASSRDSAAPSPAPSTAPSVQNATPEPPVQAAASGPGRPGEPLLRAKSNSLSEQLANPDATKAKLISRMAKMGQPMLPFMTEVAGHPESSDSELEPYSYTQTSATPSQLQPVGQVYPAQTVPYMGTGDVTSFLMTEARQHNTEIRLSVGKVADKVDQLASKGSLSMGVPSMSMETSMIMHNIQRIVQENECLKKEVFEKSARIEEQNHKIGDLINQNQRYIEQSHQLLEQRNDSLKSSSDQNQARLLQAEQEKVRLTEDLALSASRVSQLQLDASAHQQKSVELQNKLGSALQDSERHLLCLCLSELKEVAERAQTQYRSEKQRCKEMELKVNTMEEELQDVKADKESLERALSERKKKWQAERRRRDEEVEELRKNSQQELDNFRAQLRKARSSSDNARNLLNCTAMENYTLNLIKRYSYHLPKEWKRKCDHMLASAKEQHRGELAELTEQRDDLQDKLAQLQEKVDKLQQGAAVREKLESRVAQLERQVEEQDQSEDTAAEVKRVMNGVYHSLRGEFDLSESYSGQAVLGVIVSTIKNVTLQLLSGTDKSALKPHKKEEEAEEKEEESEAVKQSEEKPLQNVHVNGKKEAKQEENEDGENVADSGSLRVGEIQVDQSAATEKEAETVTESKTQSQAEASQATDLHSVSTTALQPQETAAAAESEVQHEQGQPSATETYEGNESTHPDDGPDTSLPPEDGQEAVSDSKAAVSTEVDPERAPVDEPNDAPQKAFGPPANPPPPPNMLQNNSGEDTR
uniref:peptidylprolyl isomerase n=1 Tax=Amphiprion ocellaris TaxID=80972 RepID=A0AAQ5YE03_AMPOC